jgi:hypothetical protein
MRENRLPSNTHRDITTPLPIVEATTPPITDYLLYDLYISISSFLYFSLIDKSKTCLMMSTCTFLFLLSICAHLMASQRMSCAQAFSVIQKVNSLSYSKISCHKSSQSDFDFAITRSKLNKTIGSFILSSLGLLLSDKAPAGASLDNTPSFSSSTLVIASLFDEIQNELISPSGGISYLQSCIDSKDYASILEFTKTYDLDFRKEKMGKARKSLQDKEKKEKALYYANAVTFDLIGTF